MGVFAGANTGLNTDYHVHVYTSSGTFTATFTGTVEVLVVAGGGGGGMDMGGGGGGGGVVSHTSYSVTAGSAYTVTVGAGGAGAPSGTYTDWVGTSSQPGGHQFTVRATQGGNSVFDGITAVGGGYGASSYFGYTPDYGYGGAGGSGGGASGYSDGNTGRGGGVTANTVAGGTGYGNAGGGSTGQYYSGGGGGAGGAGSTGSPHTGGVGVLNRILGQDYYWGGGGGGSAYSASIGGNGGNGGGGGGGIGATSGGAGYKSGFGGGNAIYGGGSSNSWARSPGGNGGGNTGGGGGGGSHYNSGNYGGNGGSGIVVIRYPRSSGPYNFGNQGTYTNSAMILGLDASNRKSWGGIGEERAQGILPTFGNWNGLTGTSVQYTPTTGRNGKGVFLNITAANGGGVNWWYSVKGQYACSSSTKYIVSAKVKYVNTPSANLFYVRQQNSGGSQTSEAGYYSSSNQIDIGNGYYLAWAIFTTDSTATTFYVHGYEYQNNQIWLEDVQVKQYGIADLSPMGNDYLITGSPGFTPGSYTFSSSTNFYRNGAINGASSNCTVVMLYKTTDTQELWLQGNNTSYYLSASASNNYYHGGAGSPTNYVDLAVTTRPDSPINYRNGAYHMWEAKNVDLTTNFNTYTSWFGYGGVGDAWSLNGTVVAIYVFNKTLSAAESAQLFYSFRGRLGI